MAWTAPLIIAQERIRDRNVTQWCELATSLKRPGDVGHFHVFRLFRANLIFVAQQVAGFYFPVQLLA